ncbi:MAG: hypothetical protein M3444_01485 [Acidobacteriota bacterium]|nr:hypothetical protein [Acidobacteriota bacterium]MDQ5835221.1 hypothetical protein [Acidobacteriota bacterium]
MDRAKVVHALYKASQLQQPFNFWLDSERRLPLDEKYKLPNGGYDLCGAVEKLLKSKKYKKLSRPLIVISKEPMGDPDNPHEPDDFYDYSQEDDYDPLVSIISTYTLKGLPSNRDLASFILLMLSTYILSVYGNLAFHEELRGCIFDYCDEDEEVENCFRVGKVCGHCEAVLQNRIMNGDLTIERAAAATRLLNKAVGRNYCFVAMPFAEKFNPVYQVISDVMSDLGWSVERADEVPYPKFINDRIYKGILTGDLVIADLTDFNPNVLYEVGITHVVGNDLLLLTQGEIPFDLKNAHAILYSMDRVEDFKESLKRDVSRISTQSSGDDRRNK